MKIGIKYCGGCNPHYDRTDVAKKLQRDFPQINVGSAASSPGAHDLIIVANGCHSACANHVGLNGKYGKVILTSGENYAALAEVIRQLIENA